MPKANREGYTPVMSNSAPKSKPEGEQAIESEVPPRETWTVNGRFVSELDPATQAGIPFQFTDQALALNEKKPKAQVTFVRSAEDKQLQKFEDISHELDPMAMIRARHEKPGMHYRFISPEHRAGLRDYDLVRNERGEAVKYRNMMLGEVPAKIAKARTNAYVQEAETDLRNAYEQTRIDQERAIRDDRSGGSCAVLRDGDTVQDDGVPGPTVSIGVKHTRGLAA